jgi:hypothetical protein
VSRDDAGYDVAAENTFTASTDAEAIKVAQDSFVADEAWTLYRENPPDRYGGGNHPRNPYGCGNPECRACNAWLQIATEETKEVI